MQRVFSSWLAPAEWECAEVRVDGAGHQRAAQCAVEDPITRLGLFLSLHSDGEVDGRAVEVAAANIAGASIARVRPSELSLFVVERDAEGHIALRAANGEAPRAVNGRRAALLRLLLFRRYAHFAPVDDDAL